MSRDVNDTRTDKDLSDEALRLAEDRFEERVGALVAEAQGDRTQLAMAAARLTTIGPTQSDSKEQIAFALLMEAAHRAAADGPHLKVVD
jgi:hypothetical protein